MMISTAFHGVVSDARIGHRVDAAELGRLELRRLRRGTRDRPPSDRLSVTFKISVPERVLAGREGGFEPCSTWNSSALILTWSR